MPERVTACIGAKGGVGKSTIAISLAVCATDCLLVDSPTRWKPPWPTWRWATPL
jgi:hypothetical protein